MADTYILNDPHLYINSVKQKIIKPKFKLYTLYRNESIKNEIIEDIVENSGSLSINYQQGQRRSLNFSLKNPDGRWSPNSNTGDLWIGSKFRLDLGFELLNGDIYWKRNGVFVVGNVTETHQGADKQVNIQCYDKFALLDGTLGGNLDGTYEIPSGQNINSAVKDTIALDDGAGFPIDPMPLIFDPEYLNETTAYTLTKSPTSSLGDLIVELADMIACDVYYNEYGNLVFQSGITDIANIRKPTLWAFDENDIEYLNGNLTYNFQQVRNRVIIVGANVSSGVIYSAIAENNNPQSPTRISKIGTKNIYYEDSNIYSNQLAQDRADYELNKISILQLGIELQSSFMIHLDVNNCIEITDEYFGFHNERFVIQSISIPINAGSIITIECSNVGSLPFYPSIT